MADTVLKLQLVGSDRERETKVDPIVKTVRRSDLSYDPFLREQSTERV